MNDRRRPRREHYRREPRVDDMRLDPERVTWGRHPVVEALHGKRTVERVHASSAGLAWLRDRGINLAELPLVDATRESLDALAGAGEHQGLVAEVSPFAYAEPHELFATDSGAPFVLCLDQVSDPHNLGAVARVCDAAGLSGILIPDRRSATVTGAACKASAGALEHVAVAQCVNLADTLEQVKGGDLWTYAATADGELAWNEVDWTGGIALVLGAEGAGVRPRVRATCDVSVRLPMRGHVDSLNVATVAAIIAFEAVRQRDAAGTQA